MKTTILIYIALGILLWGFIVYKNWPSFKEDMRHSWWYRFCAFAFLVYMGLFWPTVVLKGFIKALTKLD